MSSMNEMQILKRLKRLVGSTGLPVDAYREGLGYNLGPLGPLGKFFPFTNGSTIDLEINGANQTVTPVNGVLHYRTITFTTAHMLRITKCRCILMVDRLIWNAAGTIACEASGPAALGADPAEDFVRGGRIISGTAEAIGGYGGGFLIVLAGTVTGSTVGTIRANGTAGNRNTNANSGGCVGGEGAMSPAMSFPNLGPTSAIKAGQWFGGTGLWTIDGTNQPISPPNLPAAMVLSPGGYPISGYTTLAGAGGGGGGYDTTGGVFRAGGGSGFGGGGAALWQAIATTTPTALNPSPDLLTILELWRQHCRGGGGGGAVVYSTTAFNGAGGGGAGCVVLIVDDEQQVSILQANGGAASASAGSNPGSAGATLRQII